MLKRDGDGEAPRCRAAGPPAAGVGMVGPDSAVGVSE